MAVKIKLSLNEQRVIGCLLEKEITTPDQYPLSLNGLASACNQKSNRDPVLSLSEADVQNTLDILKEKRLIGVETGFGSRVAKYRHRFCNTEFGELKFSPQELGVVCVLFLRGPQTPGELRTRTNRLCEFSDVSEVEMTLNQLAARGDGPFVMKLEREPGKRESRYAHLLGDGASAQMAAPESLESSDVSRPPVSQDAERVADLESRVTDLENKLADALERLELLEALSE